MLFRKQLPSNPKTRTNERRVKSTLCMTMKPCKGDGWVGVATVSSVRFHFFHNRQKGWKKTGKWDRETTYLLPWNIQPHNFHKGEGNPRAASGKCRAHTHHAHAHTHISETLVHLNHASLEYGKKLKCQGEDADSHTRSWNGTHSNRGVKPQCYLLNWYT